MKKTEPPLTPTANGEAEFALEDAESYRLLVKDRIETIEEIKRGVESMLASRLFHAMPRRTEHWRLQGAQSPSS
jgi:hypothetical protein